MSIEHLRLLNARITALETAQADNVKEQHGLSVEVRKMKDGLDELRLEVTERTADAIQRVDQNHVLTSRVNEKLDAVLAMLESQSSEPGIRN